MIEVVLLDGKMDTVPLFYTACFYAEHISSHGKRSYDMEFHKERMN